MAVSQYFGGVRVDSNASTFQRARCLQAPASDLVEAQVLCGIDSAAEEGVIRTKRMTYIFIHR